MNAVEDLEIAMVEPVTLNGTSYMLIFTREQLTQEGRLYTFNPFTLGIQRIKATVPYSPSSLSASAAVEAGQGSSTEWEFSVVSFGLAGGRVLVGNLTVGIDGAQLTALKSVMLDGHRCSVTASYAMECPDASGRVVVFSGLESGHVAVLEYSPFNGSRTALARSVADGARLGPVTRVAAVALDTQRIALCAGHGGGGAPAAVATYIVQIGSKGAEPAIEAAHFGTAALQLAPGAGEEEQVAELPAATQLVDICVVNMHTSGQAGNKAPEIVVAALGSDGDAAHGVFGAWIVDEQARHLDCISQQHVPGRSTLLGMRIAGTTRQPEVVEVRHLLLGDALCGDEYGNIHHGLDQPLDISDYVADADAFAYIPSVRREIAERRRQLGGELFIDSLLAMAGIADGMYPPRTAADRQALVEQIGNSGLDGVKQRCLAYYLVLDSDAAGDAATQYVHDVQIPRHFARLVRGYWMMDHGQPTVGVALLADPAVEADWALRVLEAAHEHPRASLTFLRSATALAAPRLATQPGAASLTMGALLNCAFTRAFSFQRRAAPAVRRALLAQLLEFALSPRAKRTTAARLAALPFDATEDAALAEHCLRPAAPLHARDFLALHCVDSGRYAEAIRLLTAAAANDEANVPDAAHRRKRAERQALVRNLSLLLPAAQRAAIEDPGPTPAPASVSTSTSAHTQAVPAAVPAILPPVPLSATKATRRPAVVDSRGAPQSPAHPLMRVLMRQMAGEMPAATSAAPATPGTPPQQRVSAPQQSPPSTALRRVPLSGPPTTPRDLEASPKSPPAELRDAGQTPARSSILARAALVAESPLAYRRVPGAFPEPSHPSRSPFAKARQSGSRPSSQNSTPRPAQSPLAAAPNGSVKRRYNLRNRSAQTTDSSSTSSKERTDDPPPPDSTRKTKQRQQQQAARKSARNYERSLHQAAEAPSTPSTRSRKRPQN
ncbi:hypothetical protein H4R20_004943 [Coemansia guatemalensis]|uniref:ELYS-like domain-containing protein n=1 Tax=Coemansia guatemalensis TaxID=2761395 RepID=A0A9W8HV87_9FUNG|nr:hypothetical protein H4R20_004943 [Coemansia guatemalensis]